MLDLTKERADLTSSILVDDVDWALTYRDAHRIAVDELIPSLAYAIAWDARAAAARNAAAPLDYDDLPDDGPPIANPDTEPAEGPRASASARQRAWDKAVWYAGQGLRISRDRGDFLVPSGTRNGIIHRVTPAGQCSCEAAQHGRVCWHSCIPELVRRGELSSGVRAA